MVLLFYELYKVELLTFFINWENWSVETRDFDFPPCKFYYFFIHSLNQVVSLMKIFYSKMIIFIDTDD